MNPEELFNSLIYDAKNLFGDSISDWKFKGIEIKDNGPYIRYYIESGKITIVLSSKVYEHDYFLLNQLSHEVCHLLYPSREFPSLVLNETLVINEGISTYFSVLKSDEYFNFKEVIIEELKSVYPDYYNAYILVEKLLSIDNQAIKKLRKTQPRIDKLKFEDFKNSNLKISKNLILDLLRKF